LLTFKNNESWSNSRVVQYLIYSFIYWVMWKITGFEFTVIVGIGQLMGEIVYLSKNNNRKN